MQEKEEEEEDAVLLLPCAEAEGIVADDA